MIYKVLFNKLVIIITIVISLTFTAKFLYVRYVNSKIQEPIKVYKSTPIDSQVRKVNNNTENKVVKTPEKLDGIIHVKNDTHTDSEPQRTETNSDDNMIRISEAENQDGIGKNIEQAKTDLEEPTKVTSEMLSTKPESLIQFEEIMRNSKHKYNYLPTLDDYRKYIKDMEKNMKPGMEGVIESMKVVLEDLENHGVTD